jgi:hypothetical protein
MFNFTHKITLMKFRKFTRTILSAATYLGAVFYLSNTSVFAQDTYKLPGPVSQLRITSDGKVGCQLHLGDDVASNHHDLAIRIGSPAQLSNGRKSKNANGATIFVDYYNFDPSFTQELFVQARTAFQSAVDAWAMNINSDQPIYVAAVFQQLGQDVLGSAGPTAIYANAAGLERNTWYGNSLADKLAGEDLDPVSYDIIARFSTVFPNWYFGIDGNTPASDFDFKTVVLHELCHGLGFFGSMFVDNATGIGDWGFGIPEPVYPAIYDRLHASSDGKSILKENKYPNFSIELGDALLSGTLTCSGPTIKKVTKGRGAEIFTVLDSDIFGHIPGLTDLWLQGSSYSHLDFVTYAGGKNGLMVPFLSPGRSFMMPDEIVLAIFDDMGWNGKVNREVQNARLAQSEFNDIIYGHSMKIYPNPVSTYFSLSLEDIPASLIQVSLIDAMGRSIGLNFKSSSSSYFDFDLSKNEIKPGAYVLRLLFENHESANIRILKN